MRTVTGAAAGGYVEMTLVSKNGHDRSPAPFLRATRTRVNQTNTQTHHRFTEQPNSSHTLKREQGVRADCHVGQPRVGMLSSLVGMERENRVAAKKEEENS